jgi:hypothetical protein
MILDPSMIDDAARENLPASSSPLKFIVIKSERVAWEAPCPYQDLYPCPLADFALLLAPVAVFYYFCCGAKVEVEMDTFLGSLAVYVPGLSKASDGSRDEWSRIHYRATMDHNFLFCLLWWFGKPVPCRHHCSRPALPFLVPLLL